MKQAWTPVAACLLALCTSVSLAAADTSKRGTVKATANIFGAQTGVLPPADGGAGTLPPVVKLSTTKYRAVTITGLSGTVTCCNTQKPPVFNSPEGRADAPTNITGAGGISGVSMRSAMALVGVFVGSTAASTLPPTNTYTNRPAIGQVFYVGLRSPDGVPVEFVVPEGATRLHLGIADGYSFQGKPGWYGDNGGSFQATVTVRELNQVSLASVSNGCGGGGADRAIPEIFRNTSVFSDGGPLAKDYIIVFTPACDLHDAGYDGAIVRDPVNGGIANYRGWSRKEVDDKFLADLRTICRKRIPATAATALSRCLSTGGPASFGAEYGYNLVRRFGEANFDSDPARPGTQRIGPRTNN